MAVSNQIPTPREILERRNAGAAQLSFPRDIESNPHRTVILFNKYSVPRAVNNTRGSPSGQVNEGTTFQSTVGITLPVPIKIIEPYTINYQADDLGLLGAGIVNTLIGATQTPSRGMENFLSGLAGVGAAGAIAAVGLMAGAVNRQGQLMNPGLNAAVAAIQSAGSGFRSAAGVNLNPYTTALFKNVPLRVFQLSFKLSPQNKEETEQLEKIIDAIRVRIHPEPTISLSNLLLNTPELVTFKILNSIGNEQTTRQDTSFPTAPCFVIQFNVDRTGADYPTFYAETGAPVVYFIQMALMEVLPLLRRDDQLQINNPLELIGRE